uniref:Transmembrane protein n=1 Tax=Chromera velia CCMP2878 TaxID=1169474 RepID=A0A0G4G3I5_9ALVE|eukprot:Cvel_4135.t1-p1 / transcript=Cvel_4135.t1 / gene=Cvel_4135 / organism=Chromera_velia_CCMP2878 / gene_product=hypothetical protein / transcript_product=hypothetical protein / location=Cvel_scaffold177:40831-43858(-) / protein_length=313 / sequence_SO=supercontig / SO=protein_coding / is_pseudo=false
MLTDERRTSTEEGRERERERERGGGGGARRPSPSSVRRRLSFQESATNPGWINFVLDILLPTILLVFAFLAGALRVMCLVSEAGLIIWGFVVSENIREAGVPSKCSKDFHLTVWILCLLFVIWFGLLCICVPCCLFCGILTLFLAVGAGHAMGGDDRETDGFALGGTQAVAGGYGSTGSTEPGGERPSVSASSEDPSGLPSGATGESEWPVATQTTQHLEESGTEGRRSFASKREALQEEDRGGGGRAEEEIDLEKGENEAGEEKEKEGRPQSLGEQEGGGQGGANANGNEESAASQSQHDAGDHAGGIQENV